MLVCVCVCVCKGGKRVNKDGTRREVLMIFLCFICCRCMIHD